MVTLFAKLVGLFALFGALLVVIALLGFQLQNTGVEILVMLKVQPGFAHVAYALGTDIILGSLIVRRATAVRAKKMSDIRLYSIMATTLAMNTGMYIAFATWLTGSALVLIK